MDEKPIACIIPCHMDSRRLPGKPLLAETGRTLIDHTAGAALAVFPRDTHAVTGDDEIRLALPCYAWSKSRPDVPIRNGTERVAWHAENDPVLSRFDLFVNLQVDEPEISPEALATLCGLLRGGADFATLVDWASLGVDECGDRDLVKANVIEVGGVPRACGFHRWVPDDDLPEYGHYARHVGAYGYSREFLRWYAGRGPSAGELSQSLEQLRAVDAGFLPMVAEVDHPFRAIDTRADYDEFVARWREKNAAPGA